MEKKYKLVVTEMIKKSEEQLAAEKERENKYNPMNRPYSDPMPGYGDWNTTRVIEVELTQEEMTRIKSAIIKEI